MQCIYINRLEAELEAERERHQHEMEKRISDERHQADLKLQNTVERAHQEMHDQKNEYEQRLEELQIELVCIYIYYIVDIYQNISVHLILLIWC